MNDQSLQRLPAVLLAACLWFSVAAGQSATQYFPTTPGGTWLYQYVALDSLQRQVESSRRVILDSLAGTASVGGLSAYLRIDKNAAPPESSFFHLNGATVRQWITGVPGAGPLNLLDSVGLGGLSRMQKWYSIVQFGTPPAVGVPDTILRIDTSLTYQQSTYPLRIVSTTTRRAARNVTVPAGTFSAIPFEITAVAESNLGFFGVILLAKVTDTIFVAQNRWVVKEVRASSPVPVTDLSGANVPASYIPGFIKALDQPTIVSAASAPLPGTFVLSQNYPNPFNPATRIDFEITSTGFVSLRVYDLLGRELAVLAEGNHDPGVYSVRWDAGEAAAGVYWYRLATAGGSFTRSMILIK